LLGVAGLLAWFWKKREGWGRHALLGSGFFLIMLAPFVSIVVPGYMDFTWVMDHFLYVPIIGLIGLVVAAMEMLDGHAPRGWRIAAWVLVAVAVAMLTAKSRGYAKRYLSHETLWSYTLRHNPNAWPAHHNLGNVDYISGRLDEAMTEYEAVLRLNPGHAQSLCNIGHIKQVKGDLDGALDAYDRAIAVSPGDGQTYYSRALVRQARGDWAAALADLQLSAKLSPDTMYGDYTHVLTWRIRIAQNQRQQADLELAAALSNGWFSGPDEWVTQVARFLLGQTDETTLFAASASPLQDKAAEQYCEAWYFAGLKRLAEGDRAGALADFQKCLDTHERTSAEYMLALAELKALGPPR
jgi:tetratricopeptide (TPR) repeat protein